MTMPPKSSEKPPEIMIPESTVDAAKDSLFSPLIVIVISITSNLLSLFTRTKLVHGISLGLIINAIALLVISIFVVQGLICGIKALVAVKSPSQNKVFWIALAGSCINGLILLWLNYVVVTAVIGFR